MDILEKLISINTIKDLENENIREYIKSILKPLNFTFEEIGDNKRVLIAKRGNSKIGFVCHTDTVSYNNWTYKPLSLTRENGKLYGLGTSDMKGGIAALLDALKELPLNMPCTCYFTYDEEIDFTGIKELIKNINNFPENLVFPEPTNEVFAIANKGCLEFKVEFIGKSAHSSTPKLGENALLKAMSYIEELKSFANLLERKNDLLYEVPYTTFNLASIHGGNALNVIPDNCEIAFDFRTINLEQEEKILLKLNELSKKYNANLTILNQVSCAKSKDDFAKIIKDIFNEDCIGLNYTTEASFFKNKNVLILGPGPVMAHQNDEYILENSFYKIKDYYKTLIEKLSK